MRLIEQQTRWQVGRVARTRQGGGWGHQASLVTVGRSRGGETRETEQIQSNELANRFEVGAKAVRRRGEAIDEERRKENVPGPGRTLEVALKNCAL